MKSTLHILGAALLALSVTTAAAQKYGGPQPLSFSTVSATAEQGTTSAEVSIEYPTTGGEAFLCGFRTVLQSRLAELMHAAQEEDAEEKPAFTSDLSETPRTAVCFFTDEALKFQRLNFFDPEAENEDSEVVFDPEGCPPCGFDFTCSKLFANYHFASFEHIGDVYLGGAHGMPVTDVYTIAREDGKLVRMEDIFPASTHRKLKAIVYRHLLDEYDGEDVFWEDASTHLPDALGVALVEDGVRFQYDAYEIGAYAIGTPTVTIPYPELTSIMSEKAKRWIRN
ncbi:MAG: DUF3298 domain-containing protein [Alloprevotella sp.]|nr:DUF3298 domain-containing protein [Alloprevotella sp.]MBR1652982.1 DUF3298 domain-containing protein [Alloprevotella sp.]